MQSFSKPRPRLPHQARYLQLAAELKPLLADIDGFIDIERFQSLTTDGKILSLSWWRDEEAVRRWKQNVFHQAAQREGQGGYLYVLPHLGGAGGAGIRLRNRRACGCMTFM